MFLANRFQAHRSIAADGISKMVCADCSGTQTSTSMGLNTRYTHRFVDPNQLKSLTAAYLGLGTVMFS
ncbi:hypothetical protein DDK22_11535 [Cupriavidus necator]|uniref:Uncharacterized protein n=1 Tax=Cupriavidus necator TaxID=106590 RepID=A0A367PMJ3_CUPNE|nr:hypothetical protein DDK22_11535 [Cupriavidus necator]